MTLLFSIQKSTMSSHHIVRENQEPALVVADFHALDSEQLGQLLEWSPMIVTDAPNVDFLLAEGIKVDIVFGTSAVRIAQEATVFLPLTDQGNFIQEAIQHLISKNFKSVNVLAGETLPHLQAFAEAISIVIYAKGIRYAFFQEKFEKWKPKGDTVLIEERTIKSFQGLEYTQKNEFITIEDGFVTVEFSTTDWVLVGEVL